MAGHLHWRRPGWRHADRKNLRCVTTIMPTQTASAKHTGLEHIALARRSYK